LSDDPDSAEASDPAARRASELLLVLRDAPPIPGTALTRHIGRRARTQRAVAAPLRLVGTFAAALFDGLRAAARTGRGRR
jgi:hypothetical protein